VQLLIMVIFSVSVALVNANSNRAKSDEFEHLVGIHIFSFCVFRVVAIFGNADLLLILFKESRYENYIYIA